MAITGFWNTLVTRDVERARSFFTGLGFAVGDMPGGAGITVRPDDSHMICLFPPEAFSGMVPGGTCDTASAHEVIQSLSVDSAQSVDAIAAKVKGAGGHLIGEPKEQPYGYGCGFEDPDGHVWAVLWMPGTAGG